MWWTHENLGTPWYPPPPNAKTSPLKQGPNKAYLGTMVVDNFLIRPHLLRGGSIPSGGSRLRFVSGDTLLSAMVNHHSATIWRIFFIFSNRQSANQRQEKKIPQENEGQWNLLDHMMSACLTKKGWFYHEIEHEWNVQYPAWSRDYWIQYLTIGKIAHHEIPQASKYLVRRYSETQNNLAKRASTKVGPISKLWS